MSSLPVSVANRDIDSTLRENRVFPPPPEFSAKAHIKSLAEYEVLYQESIQNPEKFWAGVAKELHWFKPWDKVLEWDLPWAKWFVGGQLNLSYNCLDYQIQGGRASKTAIIWEGEPGEIRRLTYAELHAEVQRFANALKSLGIKKGDRVAIYMGMTPELAIALLACAHIGAVHSVIFGGFAANAIADRVGDCGCVAIITQDTSYRRGNEIKLKATVDEAMPACPTVKHVVVYKRTGSPVDMVEGRDHWWHDLVAKAAPTCPAEPMDSEDPLYILYTSGSTGKPKGLLHTTGGYAVQTYLTSKYVFDLHDDDIYWCTADVGWVTGHSYVVYGPLQNGATVLMYEGAPNFPDFSRFWKIVDDHRVTVFYTAPTAIRAFMKWGSEFVDKYKLDSLRLLGTVGEPINPEAWMWYREKIGRNRCPIVDTWWQTETGAIMITPLPGAIPTKPGSATRPFFGIQAEVVTRPDAQGNYHAVPAGSGGLLVVRKPWPSMARTIYGDPERFKKTYWSDVPGCYFTGDGARQDADGYFWLMGRVDDVINVSGHRLGTMEVESALVAHPKVAEAAVVGRPDDLKGQAIAAFVTLESGNQPSSDLKDELRKWVSKEIGALARPDDIRFTEALPKTRSGKIMRRLLRELATHGEVKGDVTTLEDFTVIAKLREAEEG
ncbi:MAG: acetate--CoA ligase [Terracidiphilus sp.]|jgi:acetyl-CoA synthetase